MIRAELSPEQTLGEMFDHLYHTAKVDVDDLDAMAEENEAGQLIVPGMALRVEWSTLPCYTGGEFVTRTVIGTGAVDVHLLSVTSRPALDSHVPLPHAVKGYRGAEERGDYFYSNPSLGMLVARLGLMGGIGTSRPGRTEPFGIHVTSTDLRLDELRTEEAERTTMIVQGIASGLTALEWVQEGGDLDQVLHTAA